LKMKNLRIFAIAVALVLPLSAFSQAKDQRLQYWGSPENYLNAQGTVILDLVDQTLDEHQPSTAYSLERRQALTLLDAVLHETKYDGSPLVKNFLCTRVGKVISDLDQPLASENELKIYKVYNDGFLLRSGKTVIAVDLVRRGLIPDSLMLRLVERCDGLFVTHIHDDHCDDGVMNMFTAAGKPVYVVGNYVGACKGTNLIRFDGPKDLKMKLGGSKVKVTVLPGHQDDLLNNVYIFSMPGGRSVACLGDQYSEEDMAIMRKASEYAPDLDVLVINCWSNHFNEYVSGFSPKVIVTGHEDELGHSIDHREAFWLTYYKMEEVFKVSVPYVIMAWGEAYAYRP
jgi:hypothetical protein